jgi:hypothetical protein
VRTTPVTIRLDGDVEAVVPDPSVFLLQEKLIRVNKNPRTRNFFMKLFYL